MPSTQAFLDGHSAGADQCGSLIGDREPGAVDDDVGAVVDTIAGADARRGDGADRRCHQRGPRPPAALGPAGVAAQPALDPGGRQRQLGDEPARRVRENGDRGSRFVQLPEVMTGGGVGADHRDALAGRIKTGVPQRRVKRLAAKVVAPGNSGVHGTGADDESVAMTTRARKLSPAAVCNSQVWVSSSNREPITSAMGCASVGDSGCQQLAATPGSAVRRRRR